jgi:hypothetical protein
LGGLLRIGVWTVGSTADFSWEQLDTQESAGMGKMLC